MGPSSLIPRKTLRMIRQRGERRKKKKVKNEGNVGCLHQNTPDKKDCHPYAIDENFKREKTNGDQGKKRCREGKSRERNGKAVGGKATGRGNEVKNWNKKR